MDQDKINKKKIIEKYLVYLGIFIVFAIAMWFIIPSGSSDKPESTQGINLTIPDPDDKALMADKKKAFELDQLWERNEGMKTVEEYAGQLSQIELASTISTEKEADPPQSSIEESLSALNLVTQSLQSFQSEPENDYMEQELLALEWRIQELEKKLEEKENQSLLDEQLLLMEKSYEMAARYMPGSTSPVAPIPSQTEIPNTSYEKKQEQPALEAGRVKENIVSALDQYMDDDEFIQIASQERNLGFYTAGRNNAEFPKNTIQACIYENQTLIQGEQIRILLMEPMQIQEYMIPAHTVITGTTNIQSERLHVQISHIQHQGLILPVKITVHDLDGSPGIHVPGTMEMDALKEFIANSGNSMGSSLTINQNAGQQIAADLSRGAIQGASQLFARKVREVKVHVEAGHSILLSVNSK